MLVEIGPVRVASWWTTYFLCEDSNALVIHQWKLEAPLREVHILLLAILLVSATVAVHDMDFADALSTRDAIVRHLEALPIYAAAKVCVTNL